MIKIISILLLILTGCSMDLSPNVSNASCDELLSLQDVQEIVEENREAIDNIEKLSSTKSIWLEIDSSRCQGNGEIIIYYGSEQERKDIVNSIGNSFFGAPYFMRNN